MNTTDAIDKAMDNVPQPTFEEALERVSSFGIEPGLAVISELLRQLGDPQAGLKVIHVAGTNGKGSVCSMLASCLEQAGLRSGLYTSPHLMVYNERFRVNDTMISDDQLFALLAETEEAAKRTAAVLGRRATQFEILTAMAFLWFYRQKVDVLILETGMGGRFDATNVIARPLLTVITNISLDHEGFLGHSTAEIAAEKAGIIKAGSPLVTACSDPAALDVICREFSSVQGQLSQGAAPALAQIWQECSWQTDSLGLKGQEVTLTTPLGTYERLYLPLAGGHQCVNLACVIRAWEILAGQQAGLLTEEALRRGLQKVSWPCRLELVQEQPRVVLDGSHNPDGLCQLAAWLRENRRDYGKVILVMGMVEDKDRLKAASYLDELVDQVIITKPLSARAGRWQELARGFSGAAGRQVEYIEDCHQALEAAIAAAAEKDLVLCTGSFYLVGELRKKWSIKDMFSAPAS